MNSSLIYSSVNPEECFRGQGSCSAFTLGWVTGALPGCFPFLFLLLLFVLDNLKKKVPLNAALLPVMAGCPRHSPSLWLWVFKCLRYLRTRTVQAEKSLSGGFCLPPKKMTIYFHFCIGRKTKPQAFCEKLSVGWNIWFCLTCQGLIWISCIIFYKADGLSLSPSLSHTHTCRHYLLQISETFVSNFFLFEEIL